MNGAHDLGGMMGFGPVEPEADEPVFHADWEKKVLALTLASAVAAGWNIDAGRFAREDRSPRQYLNATYYQIWYLGLTRLLREHGLVGADEVAAGRSLRPPAPIKRVLMADQVLAGLSRRVPYSREVNAPARFAVGERVRTVVMTPAGHTRLPRYVRGKPGTIELVHGAHVFPDSHAHGKGEAPQWLYTVAFAGRDVWGPQADPTVTVSTDCWESYLEPA
jgi:nitrile hydratase